MKKSVLLIAGFLLIFLASAYSTKTVDAKLGCYAPSFKMQDSESDFSIQNEKGKYVLLSFWSSADARSRICNIEYDAMTKKGNDEFVFVSVNYDRNESIYREIVNLDRLEKSSQFYDLEGKDSKNYQDYKLEDGFKSYLINPAGKIIAENPSTSQLAKLLSQ